MQTWEDELSTAESRRGGEPSPLGTGAIGFGKKDIAGQAPRRGPSGLAAAGGSIAPRPLFMDGPCLGPPRPFETNPVYSSESMRGLAFSISSSTHLES